MSVVRLHQVAAAIDRLRPEDREAVLEMVENLARREDMNLSLERRRAAFVDAARETGNATVIAAAEKVAGSL